MNNIKRAAALGLAAVIALAVVACSDETPSPFVGTWKVQDTSGQPFEITLMEDGSAKADRSGEPMEGNWSDDKGTAVIKWKTGWTTKIAKDGDGYTKTAYEKDPSAPPTDTSSAEKVK